MEEKELSIKVDELLTESRTYLNEKDWNKCLALLQTVKNLLIQNNVYDKKFEEDLNYLHNLVLTQFNNK